MIKIESSSSYKKSKRIGTTTITFVLAFSVAAFVASGVSYGAKPFPPSTLSPATCAKIDGTWTTNTCTIPAGIDGVANQPFTISNGVRLDVQGSLTINRGITVAVASSGTIIVENTGGVFPGTPLPSQMKTGILVLGTLANSGTITIENVYNEANPVHTAGITIWASATDENDPSTLVFGTLTNSGTINIENSGQTRGIQNVGTIANSAPGTIIVESSGAGTAGIYNIRSEGSVSYINGTMTNAGSITISSSGDSNSYGIYNQGFFTNSGTGTFTIGPSPESDDSRGFYNGGSFTNYGTFINNRGVVDPDNPATATWGSYNEAGTMINYGTTFATGTFFNALIMLNYGTITSYGAFIDITGEYSGIGAYSMINYGTFYNYGYIYGGKNKATCIDEPGEPGGSGC